MKFEERRSVRSAFAGTAGGFVAAATIARPESATLKNDDNARPMPPLTPDTVAQPERR